MIKNKKTLVQTIIIIVLLGVLIFFGYRVAVSSMQLPGRLGSVAIAAKNVNLATPKIDISKVDYSVMKYGFMDNQLLAQMDVLDNRFNDERMAEIRAINNLTAMSQKTADHLAYLQLKEEKDEADKKAIEAERMAEAARKAKVQQILAEREAAKRALQTININTGDSSDTGSGDTASKGGQKGEPVYASTHGKSLGEYVITAYCTCKICCGVYSGGNRTASGTIPTTNRTLAVDTNVIPFGTRLVINGQIYVAEDRGGAIKGKRIDMFFYTHKEALAWGRRTMEVFLAE